MLRFHVQTLLVILLLVNVACGQEKQRPSENSQVTSTNANSDSPRIRTLWEEQRKNLDPRSKEYPSKKIHYLMQILAESPQPQVDSEFEAIRSSSTSYYRMSEYEQTLVQAFVTSLLAQGNKEKLIYLLAGKCPRYIGTNAIEFAFVVKDLNNLLLLFESYDKSTNDDSRAIILEALSSAFRTTRSNTSSDQEFVAASKRWYLQHLKKIKVNLSYHPSTYGHDGGELFILTK